MKRLLLPKLASLALPTAFYANVVPKVAEFYMRATDFQSCFMAMTKSKTQESNLTGSEHKLFDKDPLIPLQFAVDVK